MRSARTRRGKSGKNHTLDHKIKVFDDLLEFEKFKEEFLPLIRKDLYDSKVSAEDILEKYQKLAAARLVRNIITEPDSGKSNAASTEVLNRTLGRPKEKKEVEHRYKDVSPQDLDALLQSKLNKISSKLPKPN